jgi:hypothetical protein
MNDMVSALIQLQNEVIAAQKAQLEAMQQGLNAAGDFVKMRQAGAKAVEAQQKAMSSWMKLWGWK